MPDPGDVKVTVRVTVEKVDVSGDTPVPIETVVIEDGVIVNRET